MLNRGRLSFTAGGRVRVTAAAPVMFADGLPLNEGLLCIALAAPSFYYQGNPFLAPNHQLSYQGADPDRYAPGPLPLAASGSLALDTSGAGVIAKHVAGIPFTAAGRIVCGAPETPPSIRAFSNGFSNGFD